MRLDWAVSCDGYDLHEDESADIIRAGTDTLYVDSIPARIEVTILVRVRLDENEQSDLDIAVFGPAPTTSFGVLTHSVEAQPGTNHRPGHVVHQIEPVEVGFRANAEGFYSVEIYTKHAHKDPTSTERRQTVMYSVRLEQA